MDLGGFRVLPQRFNSSLFSRRITSRLRNVRKSLESRSGTRVGGLQSESFGNVLAQVEARELPLARSFPILAPNLPSNIHFFNSNI